MKGWDIVSKVVISEIEKKLEFRRTYLPTFTYPYLDSLSLNKSIQTQWEYLKDIQLFYEFLIQSNTVQKDSIKELTLDDIVNLTEIDIYSFIDHLTRFEKSFTTTGGNKTVQVFKNGPQGKKRKRMSIQGLYNFFIEAGHLTHNPVANIRIDLEDIEQSPYISRSVLSLLLEATLDNPSEYRRLRNYLIIKMLAYTGIKVSELVNMDLGDVWENRDEMVITRKSGEEDIFPVLEVFRDDLYRYKKMRTKIENIQEGHTEALFLSQLMRRMDPRSVRKMITVVTDQAGIDTVITPHTFRRTFGKNHYKRDGDLDSTAHILGYNSVEMAKQSIKIYRTKKE